MLSVRVAVTRRGVASALAVPSAARLTEPAAPLVEAFGMRWSAA